MLNCKTLQAVSAVKYALKHHTKEGENPIVKKPLQDIYFAVLFANKYN